MKVATKCCLVCCIGALVAAPAFGQDVTVTAVIRDGDTQGPSGVCTAGFCVGGPNDLGACLSDADCVKRITIDFWISATTPGMDLRAYQISLPCELPPNEKGTTGTVKIIEGDLGVCDFLSTACTGGFCVGGPFDTDACGSIMDCMFCAGGPFADQHCMLPVDCNYECDFFSALCTGGVCVGPPFNGAACGGNEDCFACSEGPFLGGHCQFLDDCAWLPVRVDNSRADWALNTGTCNGCTGQEAADNGDCTAATSCDSGFCVGGTYDGEVCIDDADCVRYPRIGWVTELSSTYGDIDDLGPGPGGSYYMAEGTYIISDDALGSFDFEFVNPEPVGAGSFLRTPSICDIPGTCEVGACPTGTCTGVSCESDVCVGGPNDGNACAGEVDCVDCIASACVGGPAEGDFCTVPADCMECVGGLLPGTGPCVTDADCTPVSCCSEGSVHQYEVCPATDCSGTGLCIGGYHDTTLCTTHEECTEVTALWVMTKLGVSVGTPCTADCVPPNNAECNDDVDNPTTAVCTMDTCDTGGGTCGYCEIKYGDADGNTIVDFTDVGLAIAAIPNYCLAPAADVDPPCAGNGIIDFTDVGTILAAIPGFLNPCGCTQSPAGTCP